MPALRWSFVLAVGLLILGVAALTGVPRLKTTPAAANPPGNNGTIKVDGVPFDDLPDNEPHVSCTFQIDFYGFARATSMPTCCSKRSRPAAVARRS